MPLLGVCLGSQLVARAAGAEVFRSSESEVGWFPVERTPAAADDPVAGALPERFDAFEWHHYTHTLPAGAIELARSRVCTQAFRLGNAWGVQFHPEVRAEQVEAWVDEDPEDVSEPDAFLAAMRARIADWNELGRRALPRLSRCRASNYRGSWHELVEGRVAARFDTARRVCGE